MPPLILSIETATPVCSVCLSDGPNIISIKESHEQNSHSSFITLLIEELFKDTPFLLPDINAVALSAGPGSYTGLRIGASTAKGLCYSLNKPLILISTLEAMADGMIKDVKDDTLFCPMIDARRMDAYVALYDNTLSTLEKPAVITLTDSLFENYLKEHAICFFGTAAQKFSSIMKNNNAEFNFSFKNSAKDLVLLANSSFHEKKFSNLSYFELAYLKNFLANQN